MSEHKAHCVAIAVERGDSLVECRDKVVQSSVENIRQDRAFQVSPQSFDQIQARAVRWQPVDPNLVAVFLKKFLNRLGVMKPAVVANHQNSSPGVRREQRRQKDDELGSTFRHCHGVRQLGSLIVHSAIDDLLFVLSGGGNLRLFSTRRPGSGEGRVSVDFDFVLVDQHLASIRPQRLFLRISSS